MNSDDYRCRIAVILVLRKTLANGKDIVDNDSIDAFFNLELNGA